MRIASSAVVLSLVLPLTQPAASPSTGSAVAEDSMLVSSTWLASHLRDPNLVLLEIGPRAAYDAGHIPGAQFADPHSLMAPHQMDGSSPSRKPGDKPPLGLELPSVTQLDSVLTGFGIGPASRIVLYFNDEWVTPAARAYLTLDYAGLRNRVSLLDGGLTTWRAEKRQVTADIPSVQPGSFHSTPRSDIVVDEAWVSGHLKDPKVRIVDARDATFYDDTEDNGMPRGGHIPGAASIPFPSLVDSVSLRLRDKAELRSILRAAGVRDGNTVVGYCHVGQQASLVYFTARYLGYDARLYDGSFQEWSADSTVQVEGARHRLPAVQ